MNMACSRKIMTESNTISPGSGRVSLLIGLMLLTSICGCASMIEKQAIEAFAMDLDKKNFEGLKRHTSLEFSQMALRVPNAVDDLERMHIPTGEVNVVSIKELSDNEKRVTAEIGERKKKVLFELVRKPGSDKWVVDEVYLRRKQQGEIVSKPVTEQMDLLIAVREFLSTWTTGDRDNVLNSVGPELRSHLSKMSPQILARTAGRIASKENLAQKFRPVAEINGDRAIVGLPRRSGKLVISLNYEEDSWIVDDLAIESKDDGEHITSLKKFSVISNKATAFLKSYRSSDKVELAKYSTNEFYKNTLSPSNLSMARLPNENLGISPPEIRILETTADFVFNSKDEMVRLTLIKTNTDPSAPVDYRVNDVTMYELDGTQQKKLASVLLSGSIVSYFQESMNNRDLNVLKFISTKRFQDQVWNRLDEKTVKYLGLEEMENKESKMISTSFQGPVTQLTMSQGSHVLTYVLRQENNDIRVDDVIIMSTEVPISLREKLSVTVPVLQLASAMYDEDLNKVRLLTSRDFNRRIWSQTKDLKSIDSNFVNHLTAKLKKFELKGNEAFVVLGDDNFGSQIHLQKEGGLFRLHDAILVDATKGNGLASLKQTLRTDIAYRQQMNGSIQPASFENKKPLVITADIPKMESEITNAVHTKETNVQPSVNKEVVEPKKLQFNNFEKQPQPLMATPVLQTNQRATLEGMNFENLEKNKDTSKTTKGFGSQSEPQWESDSDEALLKPIPIGP